MEDRKTPPEDKGKVSQLCSSMYKNAGKEVQSRRVLPIGRCQSRFTWKIAEDRPFTLVPAHGKLRFVILNSRFPDE